MRKFANVFCALPPAAVVVVVPSELLPPPPQAAARSAIPAASNAMLTTEVNEFLRVTASTSRCRRRPLGPPFLAKNCVILTRTYRSPSQLEAKQSPSSRAQIGGLDFLDDAVH